MGPPEIILNLLHMETKTKKSAKEVFDSSNFSATNVAGRNRNRNEKPQNKITLA